MSEQEKKKEEPKKPETLNEDSQAYLKPLIESLSAKVQATKSVHLSSVLKAARGAMDALIAEQKQVELLGKEGRKDKLAK